VSLANDPTDPVGLFLVSPDGDTLGYGGNNSSGKASLSATAYTLHPVAGTWTLMVIFAEPVVGNELSEPYTGSVVFNNTSASAAGLPDSASTTLASGTPVTVPVTVTNNGAAPESVFIDARLNTTQSLTLANFASGTVALPLAVAFPTWLVPTETSSVSVAQTSSLPAMFDVFPAPGDPDLASSAPGSGPLCADTASVSYTPPGGTVTAGLWESAPTECGPYQVGGAPAGTATDTLTVQTKAFDPAVTSATGDLWAQSLSPSSSATPVTVNPGQTVTINVTITPSANSGSVVSGNLYVDAADLRLAPPAYGQSSGSELSALPYEYTVGE